MLADTLHAAPAPGQLLRLSVVEAPLAQHDYLRLGLVQRDRHGPIYQRVWRHATVPADSGQDLITV